MKLFPVLSLVLVVQGAFAQQAPSGLIQGTVVQVGATDTKVSGATVEIRREGGTVSLASPPLFTTTTDGDGKYYFPNLTAGQYRVTASAGDTSGPSMVKSE